MAALPGAQVAQIVYQAGFRGQDLVNMVAIAGRESSWNADAHRTDQPTHKMSGDFGLFQINYENWPVISQALGLTSKSQLFDPAVNAAAAKLLFDQGGYFPWNSGANGWEEGGDPLFGTNRGAAQAAVEAATSQGLFGQVFVPTGTSASDGTDKTYGGLLTPDELSGDDFDGLITLPPDARVVSVDGNLKALFTVSGISIAYDIAYPARYANLTAGTPMGAQAFSELDVVDSGDATELAEISTSWNSFSEMFERTILTVMGQNNPARNDAGVLRVVAMFAGRPDMSEAELQGLLNATEWFQSRTASELEWNSVSEAEREQLLGETSVAMVATVFEFTGLQFDGNSPIIKNYVTDVASGKLGYGAFTDIVKGYADDDPESPWSQTIRTAEEDRLQRPVDIENTTQRVRELTETWGLQWSSSTMQKWAKEIVENVKSDEDLIQTMRDQAQVIYPWKDRETETATAASPWLETYRRTMEQGGSLTTPDVQRSLTNGQTPWEFEQDLKKSDKWLTTKNGQESMHGTISELGRRMGFV